MALHSFQVKRIATRRMRRRHSRFPRLQERRRTQRKGGVVSVARNKRVRLTTYFTSKHLHDEAFRSVQTFGPAAMAQRNQYLAPPITQMRIQFFPEVTGSVVIATTDEVSNPSTSMGGRRGPGKSTRAVTDSVTARVLVFCPSTAATMHVGLRALLAWSRLWARIPREALST